MKTQKSLADLIGEDVCVTWCDEDDDWHNYTVVAVDREAGWICLSGRPQRMFSNDKSLSDSDGNPLWCSLSSVEMIEFGDFEGEYIDYVEEV